MSRLLITGGCGFIGSNLAVGLRTDGHDVTCLDNLSRRGSERLLQRVIATGGRFVHGDIRNPEDLERAGDRFDCMIECSAEPSVLVGTDGRDARFMIHNNLVGALHCFEHARARGIPVIFLSTSRVYPYGTLNELTFREETTRFVYADRRPGVSAAGVAVDYPLDGARSLYGASKLAAEIVLQEYSRQYGLPSIINRCGVVAGPWQLGKVDQGVFTYWMARHVYGGALRYIGFGGAGKQVRDVLHVDDLLDLVRSQLRNLAQSRGEVYNVGGGAASAVSLCELTALCREISGRSIHVGSETATRPADVCWFVTDNGATGSVFGWRPKKGPRDVLEDIHRWMVSHEDEFRALFA